VDLADADAVAAAFAAARPDAIIHTAAMALISDCHRDPERARAVNVAGTARLAELATDAKARLLFVSTDLVFDGERGGYREDDPPSPLSVYGRTKANAEAAVLAAPRGVVVRQPAVRTVSDRPAVVLRRTDGSAARGRSVKLFEDEWRTPLGLATAAEALAAVALSDVTGCCTWADRSG
jgi:dTDP-4-dehydrorhamnose reductase